MKALLSILILFAPAMARAGCGHFTKPFANNHHNNGYVAAPHHQQYQLFSAVGYSTQVEAEVARAQKPLVAELQGLRSEIAALRGEQKASFANIFKFRGVGTIQFEGDGGNDVPPVNPPVVDPPGPGPVGDRSPPLTNYMRQLLTNTCGVCHDGVKQKAFIIDANGTLEDHRPETPEKNLASDIFGRIHAAKPGFQMPPAGSTQEMRDGVNEWFISAAKLQLVPDYQKDGGQ